MHPDGKIIDSVNIAIEEYETNGIPRGTLAYNRIKAFRMMTGKIAFPGGTTDKPVEALDKLYYIDLKAQPGV